MLLVVSQVGRRVALCRDGTHCDLAQFLKQPKNGCEWVCCWVRSRTVSPAFAAEGANHQELRHFLSKLAQFGKLRQNCATPNLKLRQHHHVLYH